MIRSKLVFYFQIYARNESKSRTSVIKWEKQQNQKLQNRNGIMVSSEIHKEKAKYKQVIRSSPEQVLSNWRKQQNNQKQHNPYSIMDSDENHEKKIKYKQVIRSSPGQVLSS